MNESLDRVVAEIRRLQRANQRSDRREVQIRGVVLEVQRASVDSAGATTPRPDPTD